MSPNNYFLQTLQHLRTYEEVLLFGNLLHYTDVQQEEAVVFLQKEYWQEAVNYPYQTPAFDRDAALWAARTIYTASQLLLYRENKEADLIGLLPPCQQALTPAAILSADLVLRFMPDIIFQLKAIDPDDGLIAILEAHLSAWHYSGVRYLLPVEELSFDALQNSPCLCQLYIDRVIFYKKSVLAQHPFLVNGVKAALGIFAPELWSDF